MVRLAALLSFAALLAGAHTLAPRTPAASAAAGAVPANRFDSARAWNLIRMQLRYGQRPAGSPQLRRLAERLRRALPNGRFEPVPGDSALRNVVATLPGRRPGIVIGAHYDTLADPPGFVGANNGAAGTAAVVELARALARAKRPAGSRELRFVLFDGEEPASGLPEESADFYSTGLRGSRAYVAAHPGRTGAMVLLDYIAGRGLSLPREGTSSRALWSRLRAASRAAGVEQFFPTGAGPRIIDDHTPFLRAGIPAVDLIDTSYPGHTTRDRLGRLSERSLDGVGETVFRVAQALRRARTLP